MNYAAIAVIVILLYMVAMWHTAPYETYLYGFWVADGDDFCDRVDAESIMFFIGEPERGWTETTRPAYLVILNDICNQGATITYRRGWAPPIMGSYTVRAAVEFDDLQLWPEHVNITVNILDGTMRIEEDGVVYAKLVKQHDTTNIASKNE